MSGLQNIPELVHAALAARQHSYTPYSKYQVGAALLTQDGQVYTGCNVENAVYPATCCAERVAIFKAVSEGHRQFRAIAVATANGGTPCGICRQVMREFAPSMIVIITDDQHNVWQTTVSDLLPNSFGPEQLGIEVPIK